MVQLKDSSIFDYIRYVFSFALLVFSSVVTFYAILEQKTGFWKAVPGWAALIIFFIVLFLLGVMEGLQIALIELKRQHPDTYRHTHPLAYKLGKLACEGDNIERFLMGRQVSVVCLVFFAAKLTTIHGSDPSGFLFPVPQIVQENRLLAWAIVVIVAQLIPQILASQYPVQFMQLMVNMPAYYTCLFLEMTGITHFTWILSHLLSMAFGMTTEKVTTNKNNGSKDDIRKETGIPVSILGSSSHGNRNEAYINQEV